MPKYIVTADITISVHTEVVAHSAARAKELASERGMVTLCHQCSSGEPEEEWVTIGELDGCPRRLRAELDEDAAPKAREDKP